MAFDVRERRTDEGAIFMGEKKVCSHLSGTGTFHRLKEKQQLTKYRWLRQGIIGVAGGALLVTLLGCSTPLTTREKGALVSVPLRCLVEGQAR